MQSIEQIPYDRLYDAIIDAEVRENWGRWQLLWRERARRHVVALEEFMVDGTTNHHEAFWDAIKEALEVIRKGTVMSTDTSSDVGAK